MRLGKAVAIGFVGMGVEFDRIDADNHKIYLSVPEHSDKYEGIISDAESFARRTKEILREMMRDDELRVFCKIRKGEHWTDADGKRAATKLVWALD